jgi:2-polyprenyl-6-hydroxyphenyl methylase/3-demethylubiquinone-9 3-methyltransferase
VTAPAPLTPLAPPATACKCCGAPARLYDVVDFHKNCAQGREPVLAASGVPVYYHRCGECGLVFTTRFDDFSIADFARHIYNGDYALVDPDYRDVRPGHNAGLVRHLFGARPQLRVLDYGGGNGRLAELLRQAGFADVRTFDPFVPEHAERPQGVFDLLLCFEVMEHTTDPRGTLRDMAALLAPRGLILCSTLLQPADFDSLGLGWWYAGPRNGHVSLYSERSLALLGRSLGLTLASFDSCLHILFRDELPAFARHLVGE